jgi:hypothetical protein
MAPLSSLSGKPAAPDSSVESAKTILLLTLLNASDWPLLLRVVRCLPSTPGLSVLFKTHGAGVGQASREETAGCAVASQDRRQSMGI